jgi:hypothetical protein
MSSNQLKTNGRKHRVLLLFTPEAETMQTRRRSPPVIQDLHNNDFSFNRLPFKYRDAVLCHGVVEVEPGNLKKFLISGFWKTLRER